MYRIILWGCGGFAEKYLLYIEDVISTFEVEIIGFCDNSPVLWSDKYRGYSVFSPERLKELDFDKIIIFVYPQKFPDILNQLVTELGIRMEKIGYITDVLKLTQEMHRNSIKGAQTRMPMIYDCFPFFNELQVLKIRLKLLAPYVDYFVLVEMGKTHRGMDKPLYYELNKDDFREYRDKIIHIVPDDIPEYTGMNAKAYMDYYEGNDWTLEIFQRNCIARGLEGAEPEDLICISDCDEIINPEYLKEFKEKCYMPVRPLWIDELDLGALSLNQKFYYYYFNCTLNHKQNQSIFVKYKNFIEPQFLRLMINFLPSLENGGWHLTYFGDEKSVREKTQSIVDGKDVSADEIRYRMKNGIDPYGRTGDNFEMHFVPKEEIDIPGINELLAKYPQFFFQEATK